MRKTILLAAMSSLTVLMFAASPAMADEFEDEFFLSDDEVVFVEEDEGLFDALCSPGIDIDLAGCIFSDDEDNDFLDDNDIDFVSLDGDDLFDDDDNDHHDNNNDDNERSVTRIIDRY